MSFRFPNGTPFEEKKLSEIPVKLNVGLGTDLRKEMFFLGLGLPH